MSNSITFSQRILDWYPNHGRHDLPWQHNKTPYRVWVSEIMLQQTQVATVIPYFLRFMQSFPVTEALAAANLDDVLDHWSGLGYYSRARNLHRAASIINTQYKGKLPATLEELETLPGIGRSTAGAILSLGMNIPAIILDGNVKRVLARHQGISEWPGLSSVQKKLWSIAASVTPNKHIAAYNQAMMDLGATLCSRSKPACLRCPVQQDCYSHKHQLTNSIPGKKPKTQQKERAAQFLMIQNEHGNLLLEQRPNKGIWGGLWSFPECDMDQSAAKYCQTHFAFHTKNTQHLPAFKHKFSHFTLCIHPVLLRGHTTTPLASPTQCWHQPGSKLPGGIAKPIQSLLESTPL